MVPMVGATIAGAILVLATLTQGLTAALITTRADYLASAEVFDLVVAVPKIGPVQGSPAPHRRPHQSERPAALGRVVTATITLVCVLIVYDGWAKLRVVDVVPIILGPIIAIFTSHVFSTTLVLQVKLSRRPTRSEWLANARLESRFFLLAVPPLALLLLLDLATVSIADSVRVVIWMEALSLLPCGFKSRPGIARLSGSSRSGGVAGSAGAGRSR